VAAAAAALAAANLSELLRIAVERRAFAPSSSSMLFVFSFSPIVDHMWVLLKKFGFIFKLA
jgi:hypothetical protein